MKEKYFRVVVMDVILNDRWNLTAATWHDYKDFVACWKVPVAMTLSQSS